MKTFRNLYPRIGDFENLYRAYRKARRGKRSRPDVATFEFNLELELFDLQEELLAQSYQPGRYRHFTIYERKPRRCEPLQKYERAGRHRACPSRVKVLQWG